MAQELAFQDEAFATMFLKKALAAGVRFTPDQVLEMAGAINEFCLSEQASLIQTSVTSCNLHAQSI